MQRLLLVFVVGLMFNLAGSVMGGDDIKSVSVGDNRVILVNDKPFFPIMSWLQSPRTYGNLKAMGFNTFVGIWKRPAQEHCDLAKAAGGYAMCAFDTSVKGHSALLMYTHGDEPDMGIHQGKPRESAKSIVKLYKESKLVDSTRPIFMNLTGWFIDDVEWSKTPVKADRDAYYELVTQGADVMCFDIYPIYQRNRDDKLMWVADGVSQMRSYAGEGKPVFAWIETSKGSKWIRYENQKDVFPHVMRAEVWMAIMRGATGIGYFTHAWRPTTVDFRPSMAMQGELKRTNEQITRLSGVILSPTVTEGLKISWSNGIYGEVVGRRYDGGLYLFASNLDMKQRVGEARIDVAGLKKGQEIEVIDEGRKITAENGGFVDVFGELEVHIYKIK